MQVAKSTRAAGLNESTSRGNLRAAGRDGNGTRRRRPSVGISPAAFPFTVTKASRLRLSSTGGYVRAMWHGIRIPSKLLTRTFFGVMHTLQGKKQRLEDTDDTNLSLESWEAVEDVYEEMTDEERLQLNALDTGDEKGARIINHHVLLLRGIKKRENLFKFAFHFISVAS